jgi:hypothetical protein
MKQPEYIEGPEALENFERGMIALFKVPKNGHREGKEKGQKTRCPEEKRGKD